MLAKLKTMLKEYFFVRQSNDYIYYPNEYGSYPFYKLSGTGINNDPLLDEMDSNIRR